MKKGKKENEEEKIIANFLFVIVYLDEKEIKEFEQHHHTIKIDFVAVQIPNNNKICFLNPLQSIYKQYTQGLS